MASGQHKGALRGAAMQGPCPLRVDQGCQEAGQDLPEDLGGGPEPAPSPGMEKAPPLPGGSQACPRRLSAQGSRRLRQRRGLAAPRTRALDAERSPGQRRAVLPGDGREAPAASAGHGSAYSPERRDTGRHHVRRRPAPRVPRPRRRPRRPTGRRSRQCSLCPARPLVRRFRAWPGVPHGGLTRRTLRRPPGSPGSDASGDPTGGPRPRLLSPRPDGVFRVPRGGRREPAARGLLQGRYPSGAPPGAAMAPPRPHAREPARQSRRLPRLPRSPHLVRATPPADAPRAAAFHGVGGGVALTTALCGAPTDTDPRASAPPPRLILLKTRFRTTAQPRTRARRRQPPGRAGSAAGAPRAVLKECQRALGGAQRSATRERGRLPGGSAASRAARGPLTPHTPKMAAPGAQTRPSEQEPRSPASRSKQNVAPLPPTADKAGDPGPAAPGSRLAPPSPPLCGLERLPAACPSLGSRGVEARAPA
ncbi:nascent polypeptide-associated complex subunit alpha, muscle-specific form-like [Meles meles]|uniref:nascent polypeptide-associated complex subunit alpha, muscle-specific form-like n=1 Tax=Meles meles TaxID=9662 RepID=UPI001E69D7AD|nr:nascent polypeptide-associated complex subunit alpha, muscle-specific form-like [Meles meles]